MNGTKQNGTTGLGKEYTEQVIKSIGPKADPRLKEVITSLTRHLHDFAREVDLTFDEWMSGVQFVSRLNEFIDSKPTCCVFRSTGPAK